ncbi:MAG TPA: hypothetical protein PLE44_00740 [Bacilli bacterium]|nr:hypothetical protein [Bacilli bacterium]
MIRIRKEDDRRRRFLAYCIFLLILLVLLAFVIFYLMLFSDMYGGKGLINKPGGSSGNSGGVVIGEAKTIDTIIDLNELDTLEDKALVPVGYKDLSFSHGREIVEKAEFTVAVSWKEKDDNHGITKEGRLNIISTAIIEGAVEYSNLVNVEIIAPETIVLNGDPVIVKFIVTLTEPPAEADYTSIVGKNIRILNAYNIDIN